MFIKFDCAKEKEFAGFDAAQNFELEKDEECDKPGIKAFYREKTSGKKKMPEKMMIELEMEKAAFNGRLNELKQKGII